VRAPTAVSPLPLPSTRARAQADTRLTSLDLSSNALGEAGGLALGDLVAHNQTILSLRLCACPLGDDAVRALAEALGRNVSLATIDFSKSSGVSPEGAALLAGALKTNSMLASLRLSGTRTGNPGAEALAKVLKTNTSLRDLDLSDTTLDDKGAVALAAALAVNRGLETLNIGNTNVGDAGAKALCDALAKNVSLRAIDLGPNPRMDRSWQQLLDSVVKK